MEEIEQLIKTNLERLNGEMHNFEKTTEDKYYLKMIIEAITKDAASYKKVATIISNETFKKYMPLSDYEENVLETARYLLKEEQEKGFSFGFSEQYQETMNSLYKIALELRAVYDNYPFPNIEIIKDQIEKYTFLSNLLNNMDSDNLKESTIKSIIGFIENLNLSLEQKNLLLIKLIFFQLRDYKNNILLGKKTDIELIEIDDLFNDQNNSKDKHAKNKIARLLETFIEKKQKKQDIELKLMGSIAALRNDVINFSEINIDQLREFLLKKGVTDIDKEIREYTVIQVICSGIKEGLSLKLKDFQIEKIRSLNSYIKSTEQDEFKKTLKPFQELLKQVTNEDNMLFLEDMDLFSIVFDELTLKEIERQEILIAILHYNDLLNTKLNNLISTADTTKSSLIPSKDQSPREFSEREKEIFTTRFDSIKYLPEFTEEQNKQLYNLLANNKDEEYKKDIRNKIIMGNLKKAFKFFEMLVLDYEEYPNLEDLIGQFELEIISVFETYDSTITMEKLLKDFVKNKFLPKNLKTYKIDSNLEPFFKADHRFIDEKLHKIGRLHTNLLSIINAVSLNYLNEDLSDEEQDKYENKLIQDSAIEQLDEKIIEDIDEEQLKKLLAEAFNNLNETYKKVIVIRFGLNDGKFKTIQEISSLTGYKPYVVSRTLKEALRNLYENYLAAKYVTPLAKK